MYLHVKSREVCIKTRSTPASLPLKGQVTEQTTVEWSIRKASTDPVHGYSELVSIDTDVASNTSEQVDDPSSANSGGEDQVEQPEYMSPEQHASPEIVQRRSSRNWKLPSRFKD